jgi:hypothetical protein
VDLADLNSDTARKFKEIVWNIMEDMGKPNLADYFPVLKKIDPQGIRQRMTVNGGKMIDLFAHLISEQLQMRKVSGSIPNRDMLDTLLSMSEENSEKMDKTTMKHFLVVSIIYSLFFCDLFEYYLSIYFDFDGFMDCYWGIRSSIFSLLSQVN